MAIFPYAVRIPDCRNATFILVSQLVDAKQYGNAASVLRLISVLESTSVRTLELENVATYSKTDNPFHK
jgi:hypothetical protein